jgi:hypothetical protein
MTYIPAIIANIAVILSGETKKEYVRSMPFPTSMPTVVANI